MKNRFIQIREGSNEGQKLFIWDGCEIGRALECDIVIPDRRASRKHARFEYRSDGTWLIDLESANNTYVNGLSVSEKRLEPGDMIRIAGFLYIYSEEHDEAEQTGEISDSRVMMVNDEFSSTRFKESRSLSEVNNIEGLVKLAKEDPSFDRIVTILRNLFEVSKKLNTIYDLGKLLDALLDDIFRILPNAERGFVMFPTKGGEWVERVVKSRVDDGDIRASRTLIERAVERREAILTTNALEDDELKNGKSIIMEGIRSAMCVPLIRSAGGEEEILGVLYLDSRNIEHPFGRIDLDILSAVADQAAVAVKNAQLIEEVKRNTELRTSMQRYLSPDVVEQLINKDVDLSLGGSMREGCVLFADITAFTTLSERHEPKRLVKMLNQYFNRMISLIFDNWGTVDKFGGDSILAVWGAPKAVEEPEFHAVKTSVEMQNSLFGLNRDEGWDDFLTMGIGLSAGTFLAGNVGSAERMEYTVIGQTVNLAQRLESIAPSDAVLVSDATFSNIGRKTCTVTFEPVELKGLTGKISIHSVRGYLEDEDQLRVVLSVPGLLLGPNSNPIRCRIVGLFADAYGRTFINVLHERSLKTGRSFMLKPTMPELPSLGTIACTTGEFDESVHLAGGKFEGTTMKLETRNCDDRTLRFLSCETRLKTSVDLSTLKENEKTKMQDRIM
ncbi:MAG: adenylate/guanylate cyclase domain-containing protein [Planctomycetota bacterium]|nr:adenylate/guanylate cyclase domain-containing protein [Planctomycetota bacterium]